jgi:putative hydrolase of the HAD superfamily
LTLRHDALVQDVTGAPRYEAVVFDFFGTLTPAIPERVWLEHAAEAAAALGVSARSLHHALYASFPERTVGALGPLSDTLRTLVQRLGGTIDDVSLGRACAIRRSTQARLYGLRPGALVVLERLRDRGLKLGVLTDCSVELTEEWERLELAPLVDAAVFSCVEGRRKPDPQLFACVAARLGVDPAACVYVGDGGGHELTGAAASGMTALQLRERDRSLDAPYDREENWAGPFVSSLDELEGALDRLAAR